MTTTELTAATKVAVLKHLINGREANFITAAVGITDSQVADVKRDHGYPDEDKMKWAVDILEKKADAIPASTTPARVAAAADTTGDGTATWTTPTVVERQRPVHEPTAEVLQRASESKKAATRRLGQKVTTLLADLNERLTAEERDRAVKAAQERAAAQKAQRIAELEAELAKLKGKAKKSATAKSTTVKPAADGPDAKTIRAWAAENDVACPVTGRVPGAVREQYLAARAESAA